MKKLILIICISIICTVAFSQTEQDTNFIKNTTDTIFVFTGDSVGDFTGKYISFTPIGVGCIMQK